MVPELWIAANNKVNLSGADYWECVCVCVTHTPYSSDTETGQNIYPASLRQWHTSAAWHHKYCLVKFHQCRSINALSIWMEIQIGIRTEEQYSNVLQYYAALLSFTCSFCLCVTWNSGFTLRKHLICMFMQIWIQFIICGESVFHT